MGQIVLENMGCGTMDEDQKKQPEDEIVHPQCGKDSMAHASRLGQCYVETSDRYRVSHKTRYTLFSLISWLSDHLELKLKTFSNSPRNSL